jgi:hypothetical protein
MQVEKLIKQLSTRATFQLWCLGTPIITNIEDEETANKAKEEGGIGFHVKKVEEKWEARQA